MKKVSLLTAGIILFLLTSCASSKGLQNFDYQKRAKTGTPDNSVIFIGYYANNTAMSWSQCNSTYAPDYLTIDGPFVISAPVEPGSKYRLAYVSGSYTNGKTHEYWTEQYSMQNIDFDIEIPDEPGLYYFGYFSGQDSYNNRKPTPAEPGTFKGSATPEKRELYCLKQALKLYKGTEWEAVIKARMEELK